MKKKCGSWTAGAEGRSGRWNPSPNPLPCWEREDPSPNRLSSSLKLEEWQFRTVGFVAVAVGFLWLIVFESTRPVERAAVLSQYDKIEEARMYTAEEVRRHVREVAFPEARWFGVIPAAFLMFVGAITVGVGKRFRSN